MTAVREQLVDLGISEYGDTAVLSHLTEQEMNDETIDKPGYIPAECLRHIILDLGLFGCDLLLTGVCSLGVEKK